jgi:hypothetical protein
MRGFGWGNPGPVAPSQQIGAAILRQAGIAESNAVVSDRRKCLIVPAIATSPTRLEPYAYIMQFVALQ